MRFLKNIQNGSNWNIGFCDLTPEELIAEKKLKPIQWMKHSYRDRFFADPFIYKVSPQDIIVFAEEYMFDNPPGLIVELVIDRRSKQLKKRYELLRLHTHLSYPAIIREGDVTYVYPENGNSGKLNIYRYDEMQHKLVEPICILNEAVADSTIYKLTNGHYLLIATKFPENQENAYAYESLSIKGPFCPIKSEPFQSSKCCSRPAGDFFEAFGQLYRPAQNCAVSYGSSTNILAFDAYDCRERVIFELKPQGKVYPLGLHTINFCEGLCVIDGLGYLYPTLGKWYCSPAVNKIRMSVKQIIR